MRTCRVRGFTNLNVDGCIFRIIGKCWSSIFVFNLVPFKKPIGQLQKMGPVLVERIKSNRFLMAPYFI